MDDGSRLSPEAASALLAGIESVQTQPLVDLGDFYGPLEALGDACADVTRKLRSMSESEREFWATRAYQATDRKTRRHQQSYGRRRATGALSQWRTVNYG